MTSKSRLGNLSCSQEPRGTDIISRHTQSHTVGVRTSQLRVILLIPQSYMKLEGSAETCILNGHAISDVMVAPPMDII